MHLKYPITTILALSFLSLPANGSDPDKFVMYPVPGTTIKIELPPKTTEKDTTESITY